MNNSRYMMKYAIIFLLILISCSSSDDTFTEGNSGQEMEDTPDDTGNSDTDPDDTGNDDASSLYFPENNSSDWETETPQSLGWDANALDDLDTFLEEKGTKAFIILFNGKIAFENYDQNTTSATNHRWNSAAKTLTATTVGIAAQEGYLILSDPSSNYLGTSWTGMTTAQENAITVYNQLTMTTGGDYTVENINCTDPECLQYLNDSGTEWFYHNAFYTLLQDVVTAAVPSDFNDYYDAKLSSQIGMDGFWLPLGYNKLFYSNARSMARFGLLNLNKGNWNGNQIIEESFFTAMTTPSQEINKAYGYLWWLNGQESFRLPGLTTTFSGKLISTAPDDLIAGLGKNDQKLYIVPSEGLVVVRLGDDAGDATYGPSGFDTVLWEKIMEVVN